MNEHHVHDRAAELALHARLIGGDHAVTAEIAERYLPLLTQRLFRISRPDLDSHLVEDAAIEAVFSYLQRPQRYQPEQLPLVAFLLMAAKGDLKNALRKERRHTLRAVSLSDPLPAVELAVAAGNDSVEDQVLEGIEVTLPTGLSRESALETIGREFPQASDRRLLQLLLEGERHTAPYAALLAISDLPADQQRPIVKRAKDRLGKRMQRLRSRLNKLEGIAE